MRINKWIEYGSVFVLLVLFCGFAAAQQNDSGSSTAPAGAVKAPSGMRTVTALPEGIQPVIPPGAASPAGMRDVDRAPAASGSNNPLWPRLAELSRAEKENALIELEVPHNLPPALLAEVRTIENLWNSGKFDEALVRLRLLEESKAIADMAVGLSWKTSRPVSSPSRYGTDVQVGVQTGVIETHLDYHAGTGNIFVVTKYTDGSYYYWAVNISTDDGQTWSESYNWWASYTINDIGATVLDQYLWIGYTGGTSQTGARIRRCFATDGSVDSGYGYVTVFDVGVEIKEISLCSNADFYNNRIYYYAILSDATLHYWWDDAGGVSWSEIATGITDAERSLDSCTNEGYTSNFTMISYLNTSSQLCVGLKSGSWSVVVLDTGYGDTSIAAYYDTIITVYEYMGTESTIKYMISYDGGTSWYYGYVASAAGQWFWSPDVAARGGGGISVVYEEEVGEPDYCWERNRSYPTPDWSTPVTFNEMDVITGTPMSTEYLPPISGTKAYGAVWLSGSYVPYFDRSDTVSGPSVDVKCNGSDTAVSIPWPGTCKCDFVINSGGYTSPVDIWVVMASPFGFFLYDGAGPYAGWWLDPAFQHPFYTGSLTNFNVTCLNQTIPVGTYKFIVGIDNVANGQLNLGSAIIAKDSVDIKVY